MCKQMKRLSTRLKAVNKHGEVEAFPEQKSNGMADLRNNGHPKKGVEIVLFQDHLNPLGERWIGVPGDNPSTQRYVDGAAA